MKYLFTLLLTGFVATAYSQESDVLGKRNIEMRPTEKRALTLKPSERNPYSKRTQDDELKEEVQSSEEIEIRKKLSQLEVTGSSRSQNGLRLLLGDILLERGMILPQLISNQTQFLKVIDLTSEKVVFGWMDVETGELTGKTFPINYDLSPSVMYVLQGQATGNAQPGVPQSVEMGVLKPRRLPKK